jgi:hypothetical protein
MPRLAPRVTLLFAAAALIAGAAACSGGSDKAPTPPGGFSGGGANVNVIVGDKSWDYKDGICQRGDGDEYIELNAGNPATGEYLGLVVGKYPGAPDDPATLKAATGGGDFQGRGQTVLNFKHKNRSYLVSFPATKVTLAPDLSSGSFTASLTSESGDAGKVSGTFTCPRS